MVVMRLANSLNPPTGTPDMLLNGSGIANAGTATMGVVALPANLEAGYHMIRVVDGGNDEFMRADISPPSLTMGIERAYENATQKPASSHAAGASVYLVDTKGSWEEYLTEQGLGRGSGTHTYVGYNTVGASVESMPIRRVFLKQITTSADGLLSSISGRIAEQSPGGLQGFAAAVLTDNAGLYDEVIAEGWQQGTPHGNTFNRARWMSVPIGVWLPAGTYWLAFQWRTTTGSTINLSYDSGGTDHFYDAGGNDTITDEAAFGDNSTIRNYSIRADLITLSSGVATGSLVLLEQHSASGSAQLDLTNAISATYDEYEVELINVIPATTGADLTIRLSTDGGATFDAGANYYWGWQYVANTGASGVVVGNTAASITVFSSISSVFDGVSGKLRLYAPASGVRKSISIDVVASQTGGVFRGTGVGLWNNTAAYNALRLLFTSGNITSGTIRIYGVSK